MYYGSKEENVSWGVGELGSGRNDGSHSVKGKLLEVKGKRRADRVYCAARLPGYFYFYSFYT